MKRSLKPKCTIAFDYTVELFEALFDVLSAFYITLSITSAVARDCQVQVSLRSWECLPSYDFFALFFSLLLGVVVLNHLLQS